MRYLWIFVVLSAVTGLGQSSYGQNAYGPDFLNLHCTAPDPLAQTLFNIQPRPGLVPDRSANGNVVIYCDAASGTFRASFSGGAYVSLFAPANAPTGQLLASNGLSSAPTFQNVISATNPQANANPNDRALFRFNTTTDSSTSTPAQFNDENGLEIVQTVQNGQAVYSNAGGATRAKKTFLPLAITGQMQGAGQRFILGETQNCYPSESDCFGETRSVTYQNTPITGDEGTGFQSVSTVDQPGLLNINNIGSTSRTTCNTTITQTVTASSTAQTFTVASTTGCNVNDWVVLGQEIATGSPQETPLQITAVGVGNLSGVVTSNYSSGTTLTPATVINTSVGAPTPWGQGGVVVDETQPSVTAGTVSAIAGAGFTGSGTSWSTGMVGGNSTVIGCISLGPDIFSGSPFSGVGNNGPLNTWYRITSVTSTTALSILSWSTAQDSAYHGYGPGNGAYTIRPCAKILKVNNGLPSSQLIVETNTFTWSASDQIEEAIGAYPDIQGYQYGIGQYTAGGVRRTFMNVLNNGARTFQTGISLGGNMAAGSNADAIAFTTGYAISNATVGFSANTLSSGTINSYGMQILTGGTSHGLIGITSPGGGFGVGAGGSIGVNPTTNHLEINTITNGPTSVTQGTTEGSLVFSSTDPLTSGSIPTGQLVGMFDVVNDNGAVEPRLGVVGAGGNTWFMRTITRSGVRSLNFFNFNNGSGNNVATNEVLTIESAGTNQGIIGVNNTSPNLNEALDVGGFIQSQGTIRLTSDLALAANTNLQTIFSWTGFRGFQATNYSFHCALTYSQATAAVADAFGIQAATNNPTRIDASGMVFTAAGTVTSGNLQNLTTTTATTIVTFTPSAIATIFNAYLDGTFQLSAATNTINIMASQSNAADLVTIKAGSYCSITN